MQKIDRTSYSKQDKDRFPRAVEYNSDNGRISYTIHRHVYNPDTWYLSSAEFCDMVDLHTDDFAEAEKKAANFMKDLAKRQIKQIVDFIEDVEKNFNTEVLN